MSKLFQILTTSEKNKAFFFLTLIFCASLLETIGIGIIPMFLFFLNDPENYIEKIPYDDLKFIVMNLDYDKQILYFLTSIGLFFIIKNLFLFFLVLFETKFKKDMKILISENLMKHYLSMNYIFHTNNNPILLARNVGSEVNNVAMYMVSLVLLFKEILLILLILSILLFVDVQSSIYTVLSFAFLVITYFYFSKKKIKTHSKIALFERGEKGKILYQTFCSIKDVILKNRFSSLLSIYSKSISREFSSLRIIEIINKSPKLIFETVVILVFCFFFLNFFLTGKSLNNFFPIISLYVLAGIRLYPTFSNISLHYNSLNANKISLDLVHGEFLRDDFNRIDNQKNAEEITFRKNLTFENISFAYEQGFNTLENISFEIECKKQHAFIGESGSGKSTIINILMGLLDPTKGRVLADNKDIAKNKNSWQKKIGFVPQNIYLIDDTILKNIAFGYDLKEIDLERVNEVINKVSLTETINKMPNKMNTLVGNNGIRLSGGQIQRIGLARALYENPDILVLDEATSSLDNKTELEIINEINNLKNKITTIFIAHRLSTIKTCDKIFELSNGRLVNQGSFQKVVTENKNLNKFLN
tara:strand:- start:4501 stop:6264 length:1764 start_codon:yes stop_codon:yes gene_type:complete